MDQNISAAMDCLTHGVYVIGTHVDETENLMTAAWVSQASGRPETVTVAIGKNHYTAELIQKAGSFTVSMLTEEQKDIARICGFQTGRKVKKTEQVGVEYTKQRIPFVAGCRAYLECRLAGTQMISDHILFIGEVTGGEARSGSNKESLQYHQAEFF